MKLLNILKFIYNHPFNANNKIGALMRFFKWQINCRLNPFPIVYPYTENSKLLIWKGLTGATGQLYCGLMEFDDMAFLLHFLRPTDLYIDIGANVGAYTILAAAEINTNTIAFEPVPSTYKNLLDNIAINQIQSKVKALNIGLGSKNGKLKFTKLQGADNHVATENEKDTIEVEVNTLDAILSEHNPALIKIDVEGFETEVLNGAVNTLNKKELKAIIIELNGSGNRYGYDESKIHKKLLGLEFRPFNYDPKRREIKEISTYGDQNTIYIRDEQFVKDRVESSRKIKIGSRQQAI